MLDKVCLEVLGKFRECVIFAETGNHLVMDTMFYKKTDALFLITLIERDDGTKKKQALEKTADAARLQAENGFVGGLRSSGSE